MELIYNRTRLQVILIALNASKRADTLKLSLTRLSRDHFAHCCPPVGVRALSQSHTDSTASQENPTPTRIGTELSHDVLNPTHVPLESAQGSARPTPQVLAPECSQIGSYKPSGAGVPCLPNKERPNDYSRTREYCVKEKARVFHILDPPLLTI